MQAKSQKSKAKSGAPGGYSLLEFVLYFGLLAIVMTAVTSFTLTIITATAKARVIAEVEAGTRLALMRVLRSARQADALNTGTSTLNSDNGVLSLDMGTGNSNNPTIFDLSGGAIRITEGAASATPLTGSLMNVSKLRFTKDSQPGGNVTVTVEITANYLNPQSDRTYTYVASTSGTAMIRKQGN